MKESDRERLRELASELTDEGQDLARLPGHKTGLVVQLPRPGRDSEAKRIEAGCGFTLAVGADGEVEIISGGRRERLWLLSAS